jgi:hypothetical protein
MRFDVELEMPTLDVKLTVSSKARSYRDNRTMLLPPISQPTSSLVVVQHDDTSLVLDGHGRQVVFNKRFRTVKSGTKVLARFDEIKTIDIKRHRGGDDRPDCWSVRLKLKGWFASVAIGETSDDVSASIAAAWVSRFTDKKVRSL